jgi:hypothetical protein
MTSTSLIGCNTCGETERLITFLQSAFIIAMLFIVCYGIGMHALQRFWPVNPPPRRYLDDGTVNTDPDRPLLYGDLQAFKVIERQWHHRYYTLMMNKLDEIFETVQNAQVIPGTPDLPTPAPPTTPTTIDQGRETPVQSQSTPTPTPQADLTTTQPTAWDPVFHLYHPETAETEVFRLQFPERRRSTRNRRQP